MPSRRLFLQASLFATATPHVAWSSILASAPPYCLFTAGGPSRDADRLRRACRSVGGQGEPQSSWHDIDDVFALEHFLQRTDSGLVVGLTPPSEQWVAEQVAARIGYEPVFRGVHRYQVGQRQHELRGPTHIIERLGREMCRSPERWPEAFAAAIPAFANDADRVTSIRFTAPGRVPIDTPVLLTSWVLARTTCAANLR